MHIAVGADHAGFQAKSELAEWLRSAGHEVLDLGPMVLDPADDYPDYAQAVAEAVAAGRAERGVLLCGSGVGASITANKVPGIRAGLCHDTYSARQGVEHDDMNVLCLGTRVIGPQLTYELILAFLSATFSGEERHLRRLQKVQAIESRYAGPASKDAGVR